MNCLAQLRQGMLGYGRGDTTLMNKGGGTYSTLFLQCLFFIFIILQKKLRQNIHLPNKKSHFFTVIIAVKLLHLFVRHNFVPVGKF